MSKLNPQICTIEIGVTSTKEVTIYPLSVSDQFKMSDIIGKALASISEIEVKDDFAILQIGMNVLQENIEQIFSLVTKNSEKIDLDDVTNEQLYNIVETIFEVNYAGALKNFKGLSKKAKTLWSGKGSSPVSSPQPATD